MNARGVWATALGIGVAWGVAACAPKPPMTPDRSPLGATLGWAVRVYAEGEPELQAAATWALERDGLRVLHPSQRGATDASIRLHTISLAPDGTRRRTFVLAANVHGVEMDPITLEYTPASRAAGPEPAVVAAICTTFVQIARDAASAEEGLDPTPIAADP